MLHPTPAASRTLELSIPGVAEVVAVVGVAHDDVTALRSRDASEERASVALLLDGDDAGAELEGDLLLAVGAAVVGDDLYLTVDAELVQGVLSLRKCKIDLVARSWRYELLLV
jgi:hypothetical protein